MSLKNHKSKSSDKKNDTAAGVKCGEDSLKRALVVYHKPMLVDPGRRAMIVLEIQFETKNNKFYSNVANKFQDR